MGGSLVAEYKNGTTYFVHKDHLGSTRLLTKLDRTVQESMDFLPYGEQIAGGSTTTHKFTGKERDGESNLDYFGARYYSSTMGRFMSPDWAGAPTAVPYAEFGDPQSLNLYAYVRNSPIAKVDADGHSMGFAMYNAGMDDSFTNFDDYQSGGCGVDTNLCDAFGGPAQGGSQKQQAPVPPAQPVTGQVPGVSNDLTEDVLNLSLGLSGPPTLEGLSGPPQIAAGQALSASVTSGCGAADSSCAATFHLRLRSEKGGYIIQELTVEGAGVHYWEAFGPIDPGQTETQRVVAGATIDDIWEKGVYGGHHVVGVAIFYERLVELPKDFTTNNMNTLAHAAPATTSDPCTNLRGFPSTAPLQREWDIPH